MLNEQIVLALRILSVGFGALLPETWARMGLGDRLVLYLLSGLRGPQDSCHYSEQLSAL